MIAFFPMKEKVGAEIANLVKNGQTIGIGTGSTVDAAIFAIAKRIKEEKLILTIVPTSFQTAVACQGAGLTVLSSTYKPLLDWGFDGADAVDAKRNAIKGKGAAMLEEKVLAKKCKDYFLIIDESKKADDICKKSFIPVEVLPSAVAIVESELTRIGAIDINLRNGTPGKHGPVITEHGNLVLDATFCEFKIGLEQEIKSIVGVVDSGLFEGYASEVLVATSEGIIRY